MSKRIMWTYDETLEMLNIMLRQESLKAMNGRPFRKEKAFRRIYEELMQRGYKTKDPRQIEHRWKNLKRQYMDAQKDTKQGKLFLYYDEIDVLMKGKPPSGTSQESKLCELVIAKVEPQPGTFTEEMLIETEVEPLEKEECEDSAIAGEEVVEETVTEPPPQADAPKIVPKREKRNRKRQNIELPSAYLPTYKTVSEEEVFRNQKRLIDYQFGLYSRAQEESDQKFLAMSRQMMDESNEKFQMFLAKLAPANNMFAS
uniref:Myb/SANT-like DNA-binding domain-containing protein n=1 Tax=Anopheles epiroticus TaxID=199890 RepID=A0A182P9R4_9DIPT